MPPVIGDRCILSIQIIQVAPNLFVQTCWTRKTQILPRAIVKPPNLVHVKFSLTPRKSKNLVKKIAVCLEGFSLHKQLHSCQFFLLYNGNPLCRSLQVKFGTKFQNNSLQSCHLGLERAVCRKRSVSTALSLLKEQATNLYKDNRQPKNDRSQLSHSVILALG